jgi:hypothetical protein
VAWPAAAQEHPIDAAAMKALRELVESYRQRQALTVRTKVQVEVREGDAASRPQPEVEAQITFTRQGRGVVKMRGYTCYLGGGELRVVHDQVDHSYFSMSDDGSPYYALFTQFLDLPFPHLAIAFGEAEVDEFFCMQLHPKAPWARPTSVGEVTTDDGAVLRRIRMTSDHATVDIAVDPATSLIRTIDARISGGDLVAAGTTLTYRHAFEYDTYQEVAFDPATLEFDPQRRQRVDMVAASRRRPWCWPPPTAARWTCTTCAGRWWCSTSGPPGAAPAARPCPSCTSSRAGPAARPCRCA